MANQWPPLDHQDVMDAIAALRAAPPPHTHPASDILSGGPTDPTGPTPPAAPTGLSAVAVGPAEIDLTWSPVGDCTYDIERNGEVIRTARAGTTFNNTVGIVASTTYTYRVRAYDATTDLRSDWSEARTATTPASAPTGVTVTDNFTRADATSLGSGYLEFSANKFGISSNTAAPLVNSMTLAAGATQTTTGDQYAQLKVTTLASASAFIGPAVRVPVTIGTSATTTGSYYVLLVSGTTNNSLSIRRKEQDSTTYITLATKTKTIAAGDVLRLEVEGADTPILRAYVNGTLELTTQDTTGFQSPAGQTRCGIQASGTVTAARVDDFTYGDLVGGGGGAVVAPEVPLGVLATAVSQSRIDLTWEAMPSATYYEWRRGGGTALTTEATTVSDTGLAASTTYSYEVRAGNTAGVSAWSALAQATTPAAPVSAPAVPTGAAATVVSATQINYAWNAVTGATTYEVERNGTLRTNIAATFVTDTGLTPLTTYSYRVRARNSVGVSAYTSLSEVSTPAESTGGGETPAGALLFGMTPTQIKALPTSGAGWTNLQTQANKTITVDLNDIASKAASYAFAAGLVYVRTGDTAYKTKVVNALEQLRTWSGTYYYSAVYRQMAGWVLAADAVGHRTTAMNTFFDQIRTRALTGNSRFGKSMFYASWDSPNNHGAHARGAYAACSAFVGDKAALADVKKWVNRWLGPDGASDWGSATSGSFNAGKFSPTDLPYTLTWTHDSSNWYGINPSTAIPSKEGAVTMDIEREATNYSVDGSGNPVWGTSGVQYTWGAMQGTLTAMVILAANGYPTIFSWSDNAGVRWRNYLQRYGATNGNYHSHGGWVDHLLNRKYTSSERNGVTFNGVNEDSYGFGYTNWLYP